MRAALLLALIQTLAADPGRFGLPSCSGPDQELVERSGFVVCHSSSWKTPVWTAYELTPEHLGGASPRPSRFRRDAGLTQPGASDSDYRNSGYSRGHMVPAADMAWSEEAIRDTFLLSNAVPQNGSVNSGKWRVLESSVRRLAARADFVVVLTGPVFCGNTSRIGANGVAVPCELYKVMLASRATGLAAFAAILPNDHNPAAALDEFAVPVAEVERRTGLDFFSALPVELQRMIEASASPIAMD